MRSKRVADPDPCASGTDEGPRRLVAGVIEQAETRLLCRVAEALAEAEIATQQIVKRSFSAAAALERSARRKMEQDIEKVEATLAVAGNRTLEEFEALRVLLMRTYETLSTLERVLQDVPPAYDHDGRETEESPPCGREACLSPAADHPPLRHGSDALEPELNLGNFALDFLVREP